MEQLKCPLCNLVIEKERKGKCYSSLEAHLRNTHKIKIKSADIPEKYNIDISYLYDKRSIACEKSKIKLRSPEHVAKVNEQLRSELGDIEFNKLPKCEICEFRASQLYKHITSIHEISMEVYRSKYPTSKTETVEYIQYLSESRIGEKNPSFGNGDSSNSPLSEKFYKKKGYSEEDSKKLKKEFIQRNKEIRKPNTHTTKEEYYIDKYGVNKTTARLMVRERQRTNCVERIAERESIGIEEAQVIRDEITEKWQNTMNSKSPEEIAEINKKKISGCKSVSRISLVLFNKIIDKMKLDIGDVKMDRDELSIPYMNKNGRKSAFLYDFTYGNKIIEFNGDLFHGNPLLFESNDTPLKRLGRLTSRADITAKELWDRDEYKKSIAIEHGYQLLTVWEWDLKHDMANVVNKCIDFLIS